ncbi:ArsR/SmtB family transcription factor [Marinicrinis sediminis]|uniref:ArsR/SmtB family transcription factor n=1 Tax=Marinicrinis sediminis TaxID=1652465 RepID=A0ABW5RAE7_9BACL
MDYTVFAALAEPNRFQIVELLSENPMTVSEISAHTQQRQPQTSKHLRVLHEAGLVAAETDGNRRIYSLQPEPLENISTWLDTIRRQWTERFDRLDDYLQHLQDHDLQKGRNTHEQVARPEQGKHNR